MRIHGGIPPRILGKGPVTMTKKRKILFADDDPGIREVLRILLEGEGYDVVEAADGEEAISFLDSSVDLVILDVMMPGLSGFCACTKIRKATHAPILFLTAKSQDSDKALGFSAGGDDYLSKPFSYVELTSRVKALLRRYYDYRGKNQQEKPDSIRLGELEVDASANRVYKTEKEVMLTDLEYRILLLLMRNRGRIFTAQNIYESVWNEPYFYTSSNTVMVHIRNLRKKLEEDPQNPVYIKNVWGRGYRVE